MRLTRLHLLIVLVACAGAAISEVARQAARLKHPVSGKVVMVPGTDGDTTLLHNGWRISPTGRHIPTSDMLLGGAISPDGSLFAIASGGYKANMLYVVDLRTEKPVAQVWIPRLWRGIAWSRSGDRVYVSAGIPNTRDDIHAISRDAEGKWARSTGIKLEGATAADRCISAMAVHGDRLLAAEMSSGMVFSVDLRSGKTEGSVAVGGLPVAAVLSDDGSRLYVACMSSGELVTVDVRAGNAMKVSSRSVVGKHPADLAISPDGRAFVACSGSDRVVVWDLANNRAEESVKTSLHPNAPAGSTPVAVALDTASHRLYAANADNNDLSVIDVGSRGHSSVAGFIPTGWYPSAVAVAGGKIIACSGKGVGTGPNLAKKPISPIVPSGFAHIGAQLSGLISFIDPPKAPALATMTRKVVALTPFRQALVARAAGPRGLPVPTVVGAGSPIKHVLYIIKENRTYDQVFGDIKAGNGDPELCLFGEDVTPNQHALARDYVLLDNLYCNGEVSEDGHPWSTSAMVSPQTQRDWVMYYSGKGGLHSDGDVMDAPSGFIWDACIKHGLSVRSYGEYAFHKSLEGRSSLAYMGKAGPGDAPPGRDTGRADIFLREFREFEKSGAMPRLMVMSLGENHTRATLAGAFTPRAMVASNDLALGQIVDAVSHSKLWPEFAIFVIEDDAQNGPDHVDAHRTAGLLISPYVRRGAVVSTMYSTVSMLRTMELILGLGPMTQYDAAAGPMFDCFVARPDMRPFSCLPARIDLMAVNGKAAYGAAQSARMDFRGYDRVDEDAMNRILWHSIKGAGRPYPAPVRQAFAGGVRGWAR